MTPWTAACQASFSITITQNFLKLMSIESVMALNHLNLCRPLLLPSVFPSFRVFPNESVLHIRWPKYWSSASASVLPMNIQDRLPLRWTGWISLHSKGLFRVFFNTTVQSINSLALNLLYGLIHTHPYTTTGKAIALTRWTFVGNVMSLLMLSMLVIAFLLSSKCPLISWLHAPSAVVLESKKIKSVTIPIVSPSICLEVMGPDAMIFSF